MSTKTFPFKVQFVPCRSGFKKPELASDGSAAYDAFVPEQTEIKYGRQIIPLGFKMAMSKRIGLDNRTRAGYSAFGLRVFDQNDKEYRIDADVQLGLIDSDYRKEVGTILTVRSWRLWPIVQFLTGKKYFLHKHQAISQLAFRTVPAIEFVEVDELDKTGRIGGFGEQNKEGSKSKIKQ